MRILGVLIVVIPVFFLVCGYINNRVVKPWKRDRHIRRVEAENARLDRLIQDPTRRQR